MEQERNSKPNLKTLKVRLKVYKNVERIFTVKIEWYSAVESDRSVQKCMGGHVYQIIAS